MGTADAANLEPRPCGSLLPGGDDLRGRFYHWRRRLLKGTKGNGQPAFLDMSALAGGSRRPELDLRGGDTAAVTRLMFFLCGLGRVILYRDPLAPRPSSPFGPWPLTTCFLS